MTTDSLIQEGLSALNGVEHALSRRGHEPLQLGLHTQDLGSTLRVLGYSLEAKWIEDLGHQFDIKNPIVVALVRDMVVLYRDLFAALQEGDPDLVLRAQDKLRSTTTQIDTYSSVAQSQVSGFSSVDWAEDFSKPISPAVLAQPILAPATAPVTASPERVAQQFEELRTRGLELLQRARQENATAQTRSITHMDWLLSELQDWFSHLGSIALKDLFTDTRHALGNIAVDADVASVLKSIAPAIGQGVSIQAQAFSLSVTLDIRGLSLTDIQFDTFSRDLGNLGGKITPTDHGLQLRVPLGNRRMRMVPVVHQGEKCVVSHSQVTADFQASDTPVDLALTVGAKPCTLRCESVGNPQNMNVFCSEKEISAVLGSPGHAVDSTGIRYRWVVPT